MKKIAILGLIILCLSMMNTVIIYADVMTLNPEIDTCEYDYGDGSYYSFSPEIFVDKGTLDSNNSFGFSSKEGENPPQLAVTYSSDSTPPSIISLSPADDSVGVQAHSNLVIGFDESVILGTGQISIKRSSDGNLMDAIDVKSGQVTGDGTPVITVIPSASLSEGTEYYVEIPGTAFHDEAGNNFAGISGNTSWNFITGITNHTPAANDGTSDSNPAVITVNIEAAANTAPVAGFGYNLDFDGIDDYVDMGDNQNLIVGSQFTEEAWIYPTETGDNEYHGFLGYDPGATRNTKLRAPSLWSYQKKKVHGGFGDKYNWNSWITTNDVLIFDTWNHVAATFDGNRYRLYVNGNLVNIDRSYYFSSPTDTPIRNIGRVDNYFKGGIDEVRIWKSALSQATIKEWMNRDITSSHPDYDKLLGYWQFNHSSGEVAADSSANGNDGELVNMSSSEDWELSTIPNRYYVEEGGAVPVYLIGYDEDGNQLTYEITQGPTHGTLSGTGNERTYTHDGSENFTDTITYSVSDGILSSEKEATIEIIVQQTNDSPTISDISSHSTDEDASLEGISFTVGDADTDLDSLNVTAASSNQALVPDSNIVLGGTGSSRSITISPAENGNGTAAITITVSDGSLNSSTSFELTVNSVNDKPVAGTVNVTTNEDTPYSGRLSGSDIDGDSLTYSIVSGPTKGTAEITGADTGDFTYTPGNDYNGTDSFTFKVNDGTEDSVEGTVNISVTAVNDAPVVRDSGINGTEDTRLNFTLADFTDNFDDKESDILTRIQIIILPANGTLKVSEVPAAENQEIGSADLDKLSFVPARDWNGSTGFTWKGYDGTAYSESAATITLNLAAVSDYRESSTDRAAVEDNIITNIVGKDIDSRENGLNQIDEEKKEQIVNEVVKTVQQSLNELIVDPLETKLNSRQGAAKIILGPTLSNIGKEVDRIINKGMDSTKELINAARRYQLNLSIIEKKTQKEILFKPNVKDEGDGIDIKELKDYTTYIFKIDIVVNGQVIGSREKEILTLDRTPPVIRNVEFYDGQLSVDAADNVQLDKKPFMLYLED